MKFKLKSSIQLDVITKNGRLYTKELFEKSLIKYLKGNSHFGEYLEYDQDYSDSVDLNNISHEILDVIVDDYGNIIVEIETVPTREGAYIKKLIQENNAHIRMRAIGTVKKDKEKNYNVVEALDIMTFDVIQNESKKENDEGRSSESGLLQSSTTGIT